ncbi:MULTISPECIES: modification methylase Sau96I [Streptococcus]|jgi:modification methylase sau96I|uniref:Modification methylase Sau96I n=1 Tax=Streptococcus anginosus TaxID=1328 RepID=A0ABD4U388_STRAP|nr:MULTISPECIES: modification methylase Sau96I [Streptococcus]MCW1076405.1 modification methylase Sau96I [Streptococcus anginosus]MCY7037843.1 modification methylase Sau96I [Streptococcus sanguinis]
MMTNSLNLYEKLLNSEPLGFIDPLTDLGEFDKVQMKFRKPVRSLTNKYSGQPYNPYWQEKIEEMRLLYIQYQLSLREEDKKENVQTRVKIPETQEHIEEIVTTYLKLGFRFREIEKRVSLSYKKLRSDWSRCDHVTTAEAEFYSKEDLKDGYFFSVAAPPKSIKEN